MESSPAIKILGDSQQTSNLNFTHQKEFKKYCVFWGL